MISEGSSQVILRITAENGQESVEGGCCLLLPPIGARETEHQLYMIFLYLVVS